MADCANSTNIILIVIVGLVFRVQLVACEALPLSSASLHLTGAFVALFSHIVVDFYPFYQLLTRAVKSRQLAALLLGA